MSQSVISAMRIDEFNKEVEDHATFCGGGSVAAVTASGAASLVLLVLSLAVKRKANASHITDINQAIKEARSAREHFTELADSDARALDVLLRAQAEVRSSDDRAPYQEALVNAAMAPLRTAEVCLDLLEITSSQMRRATRFTVSDLGAAGALTFGALQAATMMADINLALMKKEPGIDTVELERLLDRSSELVAQGRQHADEIDGYVRAAIRGNE